MVFEVDQVDVLTRSMLCHLQKIDNTEKAGAPREFGSDVRKRDPPDRGHFNEPFAQSVASADLDVRPLPNPHAAGDFAAHDWRSKSLHEHHCLSLFCLLAASLICDRIGNIGVAEQVHPDAARKAQRALVWKLAAVVTQSAREVRMTHTESADVCGNPETASCRKFTGRGHVQLSVEHSLHLSGHVPR
jgi:hypothetical protein